MFTQSEVIAFVVLMRIARKVILCIEKRVNTCTAETVTLCTAAILVVNFIINTKLKIFYLLTSVVLNWLVTHLSDSLGRPNRVCELNTWPNPCR